MARVSSKAKARYYERIKEYKKIVDSVRSKEKKILQMIENDDTGVAMKRLVLADENFNMVSHFILMNSLSLHLLGIKNESYLNDARKCCYRALIYMEEVVTPFLDVPYSDYEAKLQEIEGLDEKKRYGLLRKAGFAINSVEEEFGENSKWRWSFVELEGRLAVVAKNFLNMKTLYKQLDPREENYAILHTHVEMVKQLLQRSADRYRQKYELSTLRMDDFKRAISFISALKRIYSIIGGKPDEIEVLKRKIDVWTTKMETDTRNIEQKEKMNRLRASRPSDQ